MLKWAQSKSSGDAVLSPSSPSPVSYSTGFEQPCKLKSRTCPPGSRTSSSSSESCASSLVTKERQRRPKKLRVRISDKVSVCELSPPVSSVNLLESVSSPCDDEGDRCSDISSGIGSSDDNCSSSELSCCGSDMSTSSADSGIDTKVRVDFKRTLMRKTPTTTKARFVKNDKLRSCDKMLPKSMRSSGQLSSVDNGLALSMYSSAQVWGSNLINSLPTEIQEVTQTRIDITDALSSGNFTLQDIRDQIVKASAAEKAMQAGKRGFRALPSPGVLNIS